MTTDGLGGVSRRSGADLSLALASLDNLQLTRGMVMVMELSINLTVDCSGLEAGISVAERYHICHRIRVGLRKSVDSS
jgi:hypothetical protein